VYKQTKKKYHGELFPVKASISRPRNREMGWTLSIASTQSEID